MQQPNGNVVRRSARLSSETYKINTNTLTQTRIRGTSLDYDESIVTDSNDVISGITEGITFLKSRL